MTGKNGFLSLADGSLTLALAAGLLLLAAGCPAGDGDTVNNYYTVQSDPFDTNWKASGHADSTTEAFRHWDSTGVISNSCAKCHSSLGFRDWLGNDGTAAGTVEGPIATTTTVDCDTCHNDSAWALTSTTFPSGATVQGLGHEAICMSCHQGRESTDSVNTAIGANLNDALPATALGFKNVHYFAAGATLYGRETRGAYQYTDTHVLVLSTSTGTFTVGETVTGGTATGTVRSWSSSSKTLTLENTDGGAFSGTVTGGTSAATGTVSTDTRHYNAYDGKFAHVSGYDTCVDCHDKHTLEVRVNACKACHTNVATVADLGNIRMQSSFHDYDGDGNVTEGVKAELEGMAAVLYTAIRSYASAVAGTAIVYDSTSHPYWFTDANDNNVRETTETSYANFPPRLLRACYNYQYFQKDPGAFAHNAKYLIECMYDSIADLDSHASVTVAGLSNMSRGDGGHFDASSEAYRHWDEEDEVSSSCARCHSPEGLKLYWEAGGFDPIVPVDLPDGMTCEACHTGADYSAGSAPRHVVSRVNFPGWNLTGTTAVGKYITGSGDSMICMTCHCARESKATVDFYLNGLGALGDDQIGTGSQKISFRNPHYLAAGAVQYGNSASVGYEYTGNTYVKIDNHGSASPYMNSCIDCHSADESAGGNHSFHVSNVAAGCKLCHTEMGVSNDISLIARNTTITGGGAGYDNDTLTTTPKAEVDAIAAVLYSAIQDYASKDATTTTGIQYNAASHPYWFRTDGTGTTSYDQFTPRLLKACFNYKLCKAEPGAWAHNHKYIIQVMYDSINDLSNRTLANGVTNNWSTGLVRP